MGYTEAEYKKAERALYANVQMQNDMFGNSFKITWIYNDE